MGMNFNGTSVTISGAVTTTPSGLGSGQAIKTYTSNANITAGSPTTAYTVTGGKTFYLTSISWWANATSVDIIVKDNTTVMLYLRANDGASDTIFFMKQMTFPTPIPFTNTVKLDASGTTSAYINFAGWEQ